jgi:hypothetical protein
MVPISSDSQDVTGQTVNYFFPVLKDAVNSNKKLYEVMEEAMLEYLKKHRK